MLHRMDDGEMIKIMKPEANGGGAPSVCYRPTELMMDLLGRPLKGEETKAAGRGGYGGSACEESLISQATCWLVKMAAGKVRAWQDCWDLPLLQEAGSGAGLRLS